VCVPLQPLGHRFRLLFVSLACPWRALEWASQLHGWSGLRTTGTNGVKCSWFVIDKLWVLPVHWTPSSPLSFSGTVWAQNRRSMPGSDAYDKLEEGDLLLAINGSTMLCFRDIEVAVAEAGSDPVKMTCAQCVWHFPCSDY